MGRWGDEDDSPRCEVPCEDSPYLLPPVALVRETILVDHIGEWYLHLPTGALRSPVGRFTISRPSVSSLKCTRLCPKTYRLDGDIETSYIIEVAKKIPPPPGTICADGERTNQNIRIVEDHEVSHAIAILAVINKYKFQLRELATKSLTEDQCAGEFNTLPSALLLEFDERQARERLHKDLEEATRSQISCVDGKVEEE